MIADCSLIAVSGPLSCQIDSTVTELPLPLSRISRHHEGTLLAEDQVLEIIALVENGEPHVLAL